MSFITNVGERQRMSCDPCSGSLALSPNWADWEMWRVEAASDGHVRICDWPLRREGGRFLCAGPTGNVWLTQDRGAAGALWTTEADEEGAYLRSKAYETYLSYSGGFRCGSEKHRQKSVWKIDDDTARRVFVSFHHVDKRLSCNAKGAVSGTANRRAFETWKLDDLGAEGLTLQSAPHGKWLSGAVDGAVSAAGEAQRWTFGRAASGSLQLAAPHDKRVLGHHKDKIRLVDDGAQEWATELSIEWADA
eukprot:Selendium_serpulae@DN4041_c0_g1_i1.p3